MHSLTNSKVSFRLSLLVPSVVLTCAPLTVRSELNVEWVDPNTIVVSGYGYGDITNETALGSCTNCLAISPEEMRRIKSQIQTLLDSALDYTHYIYIFCDDLDDGINLLADEIMGFRRFGTLPVSGGPGPEFTNYVYSVDNSQTLLDRENKPTTSTVASSRQWASYNNGIYDYATQHVFPAVNEMRPRVSGIRFSTGEIDDKLNSISTVVSSITEESCKSCGGGTNDSSCSSCPCQEQWTTLLDYIRHIDEDQHKRYSQLRGISNDVFNINERFDSYAKLVSGVLYNDSTITLDDGETWTNVYFSGESNGYDYDKSNILQRIELILFGMAYVPTNTFSDLAYAYTNSLDDASVENVTNRFDDFSTSISNGFDSAYKDFRAHVNSLKSIDTMFVFWGQAGSASPFTLGQVPDLGGSGSPQYISVGNDFLGSEVPRFRMLCRYAFQLLWAVLFLFMIWEFYVRLFKYVVVFLKYVCEWLNECFAS